MHFSDNKKNDTCYFHSNMLTEIGTENFPSTVGLMMKNMTL